MSVSDLSRLNNIPPPYQIHPNQLLKISSWVADSESLQISQTDSQNNSSVKQDRQSEMQRNNSVKNKITIPTFFFISQLINQDEPW
jgi:hypothetical protein